jgi:hypothetical protein
MSSTITEYNLMLRRILLGDYTIDDGNTYYASLVNGLGCLSHHSLTHAEEITYCNMNLTIATCELCTDLLL